MGNSMKSALKFLWHKTVINDRHIAKRKIINSFSGFNCAKLKEKYIM